MDANFGTIIFGAKDGFSSDRQFLSGLSLNGEVKDLKWLKDIKGNRYLLAAMTDQKPKLYLYHAD